jgi:hypothetical protein
MTKATKISGMVAVVIGPTGEVLASAADFERQSAGGNTVAEGQTYRAKQAALAKFFRDYCHDAIADALENYARGELFRRMKGYRLEVVPVSNAPGEA